MPGVVKVVVTELPPDRDNPEPWLVEWVDRFGESRQVHPSKRAAQRHVRGLLQNLADGLVKDDVLTVNRKN